MSIPPLLALAVFLGSVPAHRTERRTHVDRDECARRTTACEQRCDAKKGMERLSCKTDCRLAESQCRNKKHR